jgi:hypothetical protein
LPDRSIARDSRQPAASREGGGQARRRVAREAAQHLKEGEIAASLGRHS